MMLEAGRDLDAEVATKVMGWTLAEYPGGDDHWRDFGGRQIPVVYWKPATSLMDAWQVIAHMRTKHGGCAFKLFYGGSITPWLVTIISGNSDERWESYGDTAQDAICRAALAAVSRPVAESDEPSRGPA